MLNSYVKHHIFHQGKKTFGLKLNFFKGKNNCTCFT